MHLTRTRVKKGKKEDRYVATAALPEQRTEGAAWKLALRHTAPISTPQLASCPHPISGNDFGAQFVALVGEPGFVVDAKAALWEWQDIKVSDVHGLALDVPQSSEFSALVCEACAFEEVLFGGRSPVVSRATVGQHRGDAGAAGIPPPGTSLQNDAVPLRACGLLRTL